MTMTQPLIDPFQRPISYLRVSVTDRCDFRCVYCMSENMTFLPKKELLTLEELDRMCSTFVGMGVQKLRISDSNWTNSAPLALYLTNGEPTPRCPSPEIRLAEADAAGRYLLCRATEEHVT